MLKLYNTLTRKKEVFKPIVEKKLSMYSCGPTVYNYAHIGNFRTYIFMDLLRRVMKYNGYEITGVMNITDVGHLMSDADSGEDKMAKTAREQQKTPEEIASYYTKIFFEDLNKLNIETPEIIAKATDNIPEMIEFVSRLLEKGHAYEIDDGIYFDIASFPGYGKLSKQDLDDQIAGARVDVNSQKRHPADFALWKKAEPSHIMQWESPWGMGYPGWHIECSAMGKKYLGEFFDIHTGGVDHIPVHHENEIAQNEAYSGHSTVNYWIHSEFMLVNNGKMSKSLANTYTVTDLQNKGYTALDFRYFCLNTHYRKKLNFTFEGLDAAKVALKRLSEQLLLHKAAVETKTKKDVIESYRKDFLNAINDDLNIPLALGIVWTALKQAKSKDIYDLIVDFDKVLGLKLNEVSSEKSTSNLIPEEVETLAKERLKAKAQKDYATADSIRNTILELGYIIKDTKDGYVIDKK